MPLSAGTLDCVIDAYRMLRYGKIINLFRMPLAGVWFEAWVYLGLVCGWAGGARPRFDTSTDMGLVLIPADAEVDSVIFRLRATDQDADFPLVFEVTGNLKKGTCTDTLHKRATHDRDFKPFLYHVQQQSRRS